LGSPRSGANPLTAEGDAITETGMYLAPGEKGHRR